MNETSHKHSVMVGFFVLAGISILVLGVILLNDLNKSLQRRIKIVTYLDNVSGLQKGNYIWLSGVRIGTVNSLHLKGATGVEVVMDIDSKVKQYIHKDSKVKLGLDSFIGNRILIIYGGSQANEGVTEGDTIVFEKTLSSEDLIATLQQTNENLEYITGDFRIISSKLAEGEGSFGKLLNDDVFYTRLISVSTSLQAASVKAEQVMNSLAEYTSGLNREGTLANDLTTDTAMFKSLNSSIIKLGEIADTTANLINSLKAAESNPNTAVGSLLHDEKTGAELKNTIKNLQESTDKLNEDLEGLQHSFPMKRYFKHKEKAAK
jgi:phospholipid/cholesterol/gamma-HCH transport system substrate-binding protein